jgi:hypothetical protein
MQDTALKKLMHEKDIKMIAKFVSSSNFPHLKLDDKHAFASSVLKPYI